MEKTLENRNQMKKFFTASVLNAFNVFLAVILALVLSPYILKATGDRLYGIFVLVSSLTGWFSLLDLGIGLSVSRFITLYHTRGDTEKCNQVASSAFFLFLLIGMLCFVLSCLTIAGTWYFQPDMKDREIFNWVLFFFGLAFLVNFPTNVCEGIICGFLRHDINAARLIFFRLSGAVATFLAIWLGGKVIALSIVNLVVNTINFAVVFYLARRVFPEFMPSVRNLSRNLLGEMFRFGMPVFYSQLGETILTRSGMLIISIMISIDAGTPYSLVIVSLAGYAPTLFTAVTDWQTNWFTQLSEKGNAEQFDRARRTVYKTSVYLTAFVAFGYIFWGQQFITRWIGEKYLDIYPALWITALGFWLTYGESRTNWRILLATARHTLFSRLVFIHAMLAVAIGIVLVGFGWGATGVVLGNVLPGFIIYNIIAAVYTCRVTGESVRGSYARILLSQVIASLCLVPAWFFSQYVTATYISLFTVGALSLATYTILIYFFGMTKEERGGLRTEYRDAA